MVYKKSLTQQDRVFAEQFGEPLRELAFRTNFEDGDPPGTIIAQASQLMLDSLALLAHDNNVSLLRATSLAIANTPNDGSFMDTELGYILLTCGVEIHTDPDWLPARLAEKFVQLYST